jgi:hypothetical protein
MAKKNKHAQALGKLGGKAGKGSPARIKANRRAAKIRWAKVKLANEIDNAQPKR